MHSRGKALGKDVDLEKIARITPCFTGADLQNLMYEADILGARLDLKEISKNEIANALERIIAGPEKKNVVVSDEKKKLVAYHGMIEISHLVLFIPKSCALLYLVRCVERFFFSLSILLKKKGEWVSQKGE